jgi:hypothetical protein
MQTQARVYMLTAKATGSPISASSGRYGSESHVSAISDDTLAWSEFQNNVLCRELLAVGCRCITGTSWDIWFRVREVSE